METINTVGFVLSKADYLLFTRQQGESLYCQGFIGSKVQAQGLGIFKVFPWSRSCKD